MIILYFRQNLVLTILSPDKHIVDFDPIQFRLLNQLIVLILTDLPFLSLLKPFPLLVLHHRRISIHVLLLQRNLLQFLGQPRIFLPLEPLLGRYNLIRFLHSRLIL